ncbi:MAG: DUF885 domain-containing protein [Hyphomonadaceae bacterium]|nr:DUF885 domain-containing protein [Hyphomonadaceae bacterium]
MQLTRRQALLTATALAAGCATPGAGGDQNAALAAFFEQSFEQALDASPQLATRLGDRRGYDRWDDPTEAEERRQLDARLAQRARMRSQFDAAALNPADRLSFQLFDHGVTRAEQGWRWRNHDYIFNHMYGAQSSTPAFLINQHVVVSEADAHAYVARLNGVRPLMDDLIARSNAAAAAGVAPPRFSYDGILATSRGVITGAPFDEGADSPLWADLKAKVNALDITQAHKDSLLAAGRAALLESVRPAYDAVIEAMTAQQARASDDDGAWKLPDGDAFYANRLQVFTTTDLSADDIHTIGLEAVARLHGEMRAVMRTVNFNGDLTAFFRHMEQAPQFYVPDTAEGRADYVRRATAAIDAMRPRLPQFFGRLPQAALEVRPVEPFRERQSGLAFYERAAADGSRPAIYYVNTFDVRALPLYQLEALAYHEGIPGHHLQLAIAQELEDVPRFRRFLTFYTAYIEGWGLYAELLGKEMGGYQDPYSEFGRLALELRRAVRLVVDTGVHARRWTRRQAADYILANQPATEAEALRDMGRYIVNPGQATAYLIGQREILRLREQARATMGTRFTLSGFHDAVLANGAVPLDMLGDLVRDWSTRA